ncbi:hypothetical protein EJ04DRAFT_212781 [Polyplosphaeria fusca]|uniref:Xylanolytic transcriptional activator regulatory domain-containing protein n=1 Tax=Polyplosphaeria fusca TaxID=682080 RepID=A0A9P4V9G7_9PLEO|nr:hypothetical protein EJ04DRAFT_212781 [Polyplosphaeria fusca]
MPKEATDLAVRKKMRKGTHSCFECRLTINVINTCTFDNTPPLSHIPFYSLSNSSYCRRRKIRCIFPSDNPNVCSECFARGSRCVDQEHADPDVVVDHRKNLRERVSRLEALIDQLLEEKSEKTELSFGDSSSSKTPNLISRDAFPPTPISSDSSGIFQRIQKGPPSEGARRQQHVPLLSVFEDALNDAEEQIKARAGGSRKPSSPVEIERVGGFTVTNTNVEDVMGEPSAAFHAKRDRAKQGLLAMLPPAEKLERILNNNSEWWMVWRKKCSGTSAGASLPQFAAKAMAESNIGALGTVVLAVGICSDDENVERYIDAVDRWVLSDDEYAATLEGMELLILKAKWYADVGQPRRGWIAHRKGLIFAQLMGLHRKRTSSAAHESIWWSLYHGDRFLSLLLGLPYAVLDSHCDLTLPEMPGEYMAPLVFMNKISILAGKVIDRNQGIAEQSFAWALQLDQELEDLYKRLDPSWLDINSLLDDIESNAADLRERLMGQMVYHQIRVYLHLPFMLKSQSNSRFTYSRTACLNGSREVLRLYRMLRAGQTQPLYECKAVDFIGFTAAVLIMLGLLNFGAAAGTMSPKDQEADVRLVEISIDIFRRASSEKGGKVAHQSAEVLEKMLRKMRADGGCREEGDGCDGDDFIIPYFGTISIRRGGKRERPPPMPTLEAAQLRSLSSSTQFTPSSETSGSELFTQNNLSSATSNETFNLSSDPFVSYDGFYNWNDPASNTTDGTAIGTQVNDDSMNNFPLPTNNFSWQNMPMDIDQDWSWFLNDAQQNPTVQPVGDAFTQQTFAGFS